jgi:hypothetical protein
MTDGVTWREDLDAITFIPKGHRGVCAVHRLAFRRLLLTEPTLASCTAYFAEHRDAFQAAASEKMRQKGLAINANFHLTSRDVAKQLRSPVDPFG